MDHTCRWCGFAGPSRIYGELCGWTLARTHARSRDRIAIAAYLGSSDIFDQAITRFAAAYADQNERDHKSLVDTVASGRVTAERYMLDPATIDRVDECPGCGEQRDERDNRAR